MLGDAYTPFLVFAGVMGSAYITYLGTTYRFRNKPTDPTSELFKYYDQMLKNAWEQGKEKDLLIGKLETSLNKIQAELWDTKNLLVETKQKLQDATDQNERIRKKLTDAQLAFNNSTP